MKTYPLISASVFRLAGLTQIIFLFFIWPLANACFGDDAPSTNIIPWSDNFENQYTNMTPLNTGTNGWYASSADCMVLSNVLYSGTGTWAAMLPTDVTLSNKFTNAYTRIVTMEMYIQPQFYDGTNYPNISSTNNDLGLSTNAAAQFFINSNGFFVISNGTNWNETTKMADGNPAIAITTSYYTRIQVNLRYKNHTWNLKAWTNVTDNDLVANTPYVNFTSNLNTFSGFSIYNGNSTSYLDEVSVITGRPAAKINGVSFDAINRINGAAHPGFINGVSE